MYRFVLLLAIAINLVTTSSAEAYTVVSTQSARIDDLHTLYLITYAFGHQKYDFSLPGKAERNDRQDLNALEYTMQTPEGLTIKDGRTVAAIWSKTKRAGNKYIAPVGTSTKFTLAVLHQKSSPASRANTMSVTALPFLIGQTASDLKKHELEQFSASATGTTELPTEAN